MPSPASNFRRRDWWQSWAWGLFVTGVVVVLHAAGTLDFTERWAFDKRVQLCQLFVRDAGAPPQVVAVLIDEPTLGQFGSWPWPRAKVAELIRQIELCGARTIGLDVLIAERKSDDDVLAAAIKSNGHVVLPLEIDLAREQPDHPLRGAIKSLLSSDPELWPEQIADALRAHPRARGLSDVELLAAVKQDYADLRDDELIARINHELASGTGTAEIWRKVIPKTAATGARSQITRLVEDLIQRARAMRAVHQKLPPAHESPPLLWAPPRTRTSTEQVITAARGIGFVDFKVEPGGKLRSIPLLANLDGRAIPQFALALACAHLDIDVRDANAIRVDDDQIELRAPNRTPIRIPVRTERSPDRKLLVGTMFEIPQHGRRNEPWRIFDSPAGAARANLHAISTAGLADIIVREESLRNNNEMLDTAIRFFLAFRDPDELAAFDALKLPADDFATRRTWLKGLVEDSYLQKLDAQYRAVPPNDLDDAGLTFVKHFQTLGANMEKNDALLKQIHAIRDELTVVLKGRAVIVGFEASGMVDQVSTALHDRLPGAMVHAAIAHAILGGEMWRKAPLWLNLLATAALGFTATWLVTCRGQYRAHLAALGLLVAYAVFNGFVLFDYGNYILSLAYPAIAIAGVWGIIIARRALIEAFVRSIVEREFRTYVDPALVDYALANKQQTGDRIRAQRREMSIVFVDLEGFTTRSEQLQSRAARVVNFYMNLMVRIIRKNDGYVNKFLGDGIMFFFNAPPRPNERHAMCAVRTVLEIQSAVRDVVEGKHKRSRTGFRVRAGVSTGVVTVGDAGSSDASDYTVLGDIANLGARLESANKQFDTSCLVNARTAELCGNEFLMRPIGSIKVVGRAEPVDVAEPLVSSRAADPRLRELADVTRKMVMCFKTADFRGCLEAIARVESIAGSSRLTAIYRDQTERRIAQPVPNDWCGVIELAAK